jgi:hypothetical protein
VTKLDGNSGTLLYSTYLGGDTGEHGSAESAGGIAVDASGYAYITGYTATNFPTTSGAFQRTRRGYQDVFVTKLNVDGSGLVYSTLLGADPTTLSAGYGIVVDGEGNAYVTGATTGPGFPTTPGAFQSTYRGGAHDVFLTELNLTGSALVYSTYLGGSSDDGSPEQTGAGSAIARDSAGHLYVTGQTTSADFPTSAGAMATMPPGGLDAFVMKFDPGVSSPIYSTYLGGGDWDAGIGIAGDSSGKAYVVSMTLSSDFPTSPGGFQPMIAARIDAAVTKLDPTGALLWSTFLGGSENENGVGGIGVDGLGNVHIAGSTWSTDFPVTPGAFQTSGLGGFVTMLGSNGDLFPVAPPIQIRINDVSLPEGKKGTTPFVFTVSLSSPSTASISVNYDTQDGTATAPRDYQSIRGSVTFAPGETNKTVTVLVNGDTTVEPDETFYVNLTYATGGTVVDSQGLGTIRNDDAKRGAASTITIPLITDSLIVAGVLPLAPAPAWLAPPSATTGFLLAASQTVQYPSPAAVSAEPTPAIVTAAPVPAGRSALRDINILDRVFTMFADEEHLGKEADA